LVADAEEPGVRGFVFPRSTCVTPAGQRAVSASEDHTLKLWDLESGSIPSRDHPHGQIGMRQRPETQRYVALSSPIHRRSRTPSK
jgi:WD40 repeat protein